MSASFARLSISSLSSSSVHRASIANAVVCVSIMISTVVFSSGLVMFSFSRVLWMSLAALSVAGWGMMVTMASSNTVIQTIVDEEKRGRVMSFYSIAFQGIAPFGSLFAGMIANRVGPPLTLALRLSWRLMKSKGQRPIADAVVKTSTQARSSAGAFGAITCTRNGAL